MNNFKKGDLVYYDFKRIDLSKKDNTTGFFCVVRGIQEYRVIQDYILLVYEHEKDNSSLLYRFVANPEHLVKVDPDTPQNRLAIQLKHG